MVESRSLNGPLDYGGTCNVCSFCTLDGYGEFCVVASGHPDGECGGRADGHEAEVLQVDADAVEPAAAGVAEHLVVVAVAHAAQEGRAGHLFAVERHLDLVRQRLLRCVRDQALAAAEDLHGVGDVAVVDADLKLALAGLRSVHCNIKQILNKTTNVHR